MPVPWLPWHKPIRLLVARDEQSCLNGPQLRTAMPGTAGVSVAEADAGHGGRDSQLWCMLDRRSVGALGERSAAAIDLAQRTRQPPYRRRAASRRQHSGNRHSAETDADVQRHWEAWWGPASSGRLRRGWRRGRWRKPRLHELGRLAHLEK